MCWREGTGDRQMLVTMKEPSEATVETRSAYSETRAAPVACIELDRFCEHCGYNLRTLPVYRETRTGIPVVRCTECGRFQSANDTSTALRPWLHRATSVLLITWMLAIVAGFFFLGLAEGATSYATLDELTIRGGSESRRVGTTTIYTWTGNYGPLEVKADFPEYKLFVTLILTGSFMIAFSCGLFAVVVLPHWRRVAYVGLMLAMPIVVGCLVAIAWAHDAPHLFDWGLPYVGAHTGLQLLGGVVGVIFGRPLARLAVHIFLPPSVRPRLAYLWLADGKAFPRP
jgi:hypothetical protein